MPIFLGNNTLTGGAAAAGGSTVVIGGVTYPAPFYGSNFERVPVASYITSLGLTFFGTTDITQGTVSTGVRTELYNHTGAGALQAISLIYSSRWNSGTSTADSIAEFSESTLEIEVDGTAYTYVMSGKRLNAGRVGTGIVNRDDKCMVVGGVPIPTSSAPGGFGGPILLNDQPIAKMANNTNSPFVEHTGANMAGVTYVPSSEQWFGNGLPWLHYTTSLVINYTSGTTSSVTNANTLVSAINVQAQVVQF